MKVLEVRNVNHAVAKAIPYLLSEGLTERSRNGDVLVAPGPVMTVYQNPRERVLYSQTRDANPFFHLMESLWMLAGRNDLAFPMYFNKRFESYSDDGKFIHGAYGYRWRLWFGMDQIAHIVEELREKPGSRRAVLQMWSAPGDLCSIGIGDDKGNVVDQIGGLNCKDVPCNTHAYFDLRHGKLNMTVCNRSNDAIWGAYGANAVHFSILQEYIASQLNATVGVYRQFSNNFHAYTDVYNIEKLQKIAGESAASDFYKVDKGFFIDKNNVVEPYPLMTVKSVELWNEDLRNFMAAPDRLHTYADPFFSLVARPMYLAWMMRKEKLGNGHAEVERIVAKDWKLACTQWIARRERNKH